MLYEKILILGPDLKCLSFRIDVKMLGFFVCLFVCFEKRNSGQQYRNEIKIRCFTLCGNTFILLY